MISQLILSESKQWDRKTIDDDINCFLEVIERHIGHNFEVKYNNKC